MRVLSVVGARPNFMKIAPVVAQLRGVEGVEQCLVHTGQHYDENLSGRFFGELGLPEPDVNLQVGSGSHTWQTAEIMLRLEPVLQQYQPDVVIVVGDVNSTLAAALAAAKLAVPVAHIEAGLRSFDPTMPEEINRKLTDAVSSLLFATEESGVRNLQAEGVPAERIYFVGNVMIDTLLGHRALAAQSAILQNLRLGTRDSVAPYAVLTLHRPSNVDEPQTLTRLMEAIAEIARDLPIIFPIHARTLERMRRLKLENYLDSNAAAGLRTLSPLGYLDFLCLMDHAKLVLTDSGGIQEETTVLGVPCLTLRHNTERPVTVEQGTNQVIGTDPDRIVEGARQVLRRPAPLPRRPPLWDGKAAQRIVEILLAQNQLCGANASQLKEN